MFVNAWNAWNDGLFLEPDKHGGFNRLNETSRALLGIPSGTTMPKVSVIVPNYNHEKFLRRRLDSIYGQNPIRTSRSSCSTTARRTRAVP